MVMQETNFINISLVSEYYINQRNLGDVFISPCQSEMYSSDHSGICKDCTKCLDNEYAVYPCLIYQNRVCRNCTRCTSRETEICFCGYRTPTCYTGDRVCAPLIPKDVALAIQFSVPKTLTPLEQQFVKSGFSTGYLLFLSLTFSHNVNNIRFVGMSQVSEVVYNASFVMEKVYDPAIVYALNHMTTADVQDGLKFTFGATKRRLLIENPVQLISIGVSSSCSTTATACENPFYVLPPDAHDCNAICVPAPCPIGYTGPDGVCEPCLSGTYKNVAGNSTCDLCPAGLSSMPGANSSDLCMVIGPQPTTTSVTSYTTTTSTNSQVSTPQTTQKQPGATTTQPKITTVPISPQVTTQVSGNPPNPPPPTTSSSSTFSSNFPYVIVMDGSNSIVMVVGIMVAGIVAVLLAAIGALVYCFRLLRSNRGYEPITRQKPVIRHPIVRPH